MKNNKANRLRLAEAIWEVLTLDNIREQFIAQSIKRYEDDPDQFEGDCAFMGLDSKGGE